MNKKTTSRIHVSRALVAVLVGLIAVPTAMTGFMRTIDNGNGVSINLEQKAINDVGRVRYIRRNYWRAVDVHNELVSLGKLNLVTPDINNLDTIAYYLDAENFVEEDAEHASAPEEAQYLVSVSDTQHTYKMLPENWRDLVDGYVQTQFCAPTLSKYTVQLHEDVDLYDLCQRMLDEHVAAISPNLLDRSSFLRGHRADRYEPTSAIYSRLNLLEEALYPREHSGYRPRLDYSKYHEATDE